MTQLIDLGFAGSNTYRLMRQPPEIGAIRIKHWRYVVAPDGPEDPVWAKRVGDYWRLQEETYGLRFDDRIDMFIDFQLGLVSSAARIVDILPGQRTKDYVAPRVRERSMA